jgi:hypothetical protein
VSLYSLLAARWLAVELGVARSSVLEQLLQQLVVINEVMRELNGGRGERLTLSV